jgi:hypothetical protein
MRSIGYQTSQGQPSEIIPRGNLRGRTQQGRDSWRQCPLAGVGVEPVQSLCDAHRNQLVLYGKEKVYGSIP